MAFPSDLTRTKNWGTEILTDSDLEGQFDLIINWVMASNHSTTGHTHDGTSNQGPKIPVTNLTVGSQALGDLIYASSSSAWTRVAGNTTATKKFLAQTGDGSASAAPSWATIVAGDLPTLSASNLPNGASVQTVNTITGAVSTGSTAIPDDDTIPQNTEGDQVMSLAITPNATTNKLKIDVVVHAQNGGGSVITAALFQDSTANALAVGAQQNGGGNAMQPICFTHYMTASTTSATTFKVRIGGTAGTTTFNGSASSRKFGGVLASSITITEIKSA